MANARSRFSPLLILGGICASYNPEPLANIFDLIFLGDGENSITQFLDKVARYGDNEEKNEFLDRFSGIPAFYLPGKFQPVYNDKGNLQEIKKESPHLKLPEHNWISRLDDYPCMSELLTNDTEFGDMVLIELSRGCPRKCSFCLIGECYGKFRTRSYDIIMQQVKIGLQYRKKIGLIGANIADYPDLSNLVNKIRDLDGTVSFPSLRLDLLDTDLLKTTAAETQKTITLAPEAGSERLRKLIGKPMSNEKIENIVVDLLGQGHRKIKLYLMVGLPTEQKSDIEAIAEMVKKLRHRIAALQKWKKGYAPIILSINCFVPKPFTPFQWAPMDTIKNLKEKISFIKKCFKKEPLVSVIHDVPKWAMIQGLLARGDRKLVYLLQAVLEHQNNWKDGIQQSNINTSYYVTRQRTCEEILPWDHLMDTKLKQRLWERYEPVHQQIQ